MATTAPSKAALKRRAKAILNEATLHSLLPDEEFEFICSISRQYIDGWIGEAFIGITVFITPKYKTRSFAYVLRNGDRCPFSYLRAIDGDKGARDTRMAFRSAIANQIHAFKKSQTVSPGMLRCSASGDVAAWNEVDVHHDPPFNVLLEGFLESCDVELKEIQITVDFENIELKDESLKESWQNYHEEKASLAVVKKSQHDLLHRKEGN